MKEVEFEIHLLLKSYFADPLSFEIRQRNTYAEKQKSTELTKTLKKMKINIVKPKSDKALYNMNRITPEIANVIDIE